MTSQENKYFLEHIQNAMTTIRPVRQRPDNKRILKHAQQSATTNLDQDHIDQILQELLKSNLVYNRPTESGPSYYVTDKNSDSNVDANNTDNPECMSDSDSDEPGVFHAVVTPNSKPDKKPENLDKTPF